MEDGFRTARRFGALQFGTFVAAGVAATALFGFTGQAEAAGFALKEQSATALGNAFAGATAGADDISYMFFNPAGLTRHDGNYGALVASFIVPVAETHDASDGLSILPGSASQDGGVGTFVPAAYLMWSVNQDLKFGIGVNAPFGLSTEYDLNWQGAFYAIESKVQTVNINPTLSYRVNNMLSLGVGLQAQQIDVTLSQQLPSAGFPLFEVEGNDWGYGFNVGAMLELTPQTRIGASYRSQIDSEISGSAAIVGVASTAASADLTTPDVASIGFYHELTGSVAVMAEASWTGWSSFDQIRIDMAPSVVTGALGTTTIIVPEDWDDVWFYSVGATWRPNQDWALRTGVAYDDSPIPNSTKSPRLPGNDRLWLALGAEYSPTPFLSFSAGYTHIWVHDGTINLTSPVPFTASYEGKIDIVTAQLTIQF